ncbi:MAG TPA: cell division protein ZapA [Patescibacteria group bacterium]|nr:cell division protein ZapA [Patescibacteria group bacterium]
MSDPVSVSILDREYLVACPPEERDGLRSAASLLDGRLRDLRNAARNATPERIAVLAALNLAHELLQVRAKQGATGHVVDAELAALRIKLDAALGSLHNTRAP